MIEYLHWCEDLELEPILAIWDGFYLSGPVTPQDQLQPWIQFALDELEFLMGSTSTKYGALRASLGYPQPFQINYVEVSLFSGPPVSSFVFLTIGTRLVTKTTLVVVMPVTLHTVYPCSPARSRQSTLISPLLRRLLLSTPSLTTFLSTTTSIPDPTTLSENSISLTTTTGATLS